jgi:CubicO group peptidase (beta-lactamase class C family)
MRVVLPVLLLAACTPTVDPAVRGARPSDRALERAWSQVLDDITVWRAEEGVAGVAVAVIVDGRTRFADGFGLAGDEPVHTGTVFRWASVSKPFVATATLQAEAQGLLSLDDPLSDWLPDFTTEGPFTEEEPRLHHLLDHRSGIADRLVWRCNTADDWLLDTFSGGVDLPLLAPPGAFYNYSNSGFSALGAVLELAHGRPFVELIDDEVLAPAGMRSGTFSADDAADMGASPGLGAEGAVMNVEEWDCASARPAAWLHADVVDVARFVEQLDEGPIAPRMASAADTHLRADGGYRVGPGLFAIDYRSRHEAWVHDGWVTGFTSELAWLPEERLGLVLVANRGPVDLGRLRWTILDRFLGYDPEEPRTDPVRDQLHPTLVGRYEQPVEGFAPPWATGRMEIVWWDGALHLRTANPELGLFPVVQTDGDAYGVWVGGTGTTLRFLTYEGRRYMVNREFVARQVELDIE